MPNMVSTLSGFNVSARFVLVKKEIDDGDIVESSKVRPPLYFQGNMMPIHPKDLLVKPEGERRFKWWTMHTTLQLQVDDEIKDKDGLIYRVMNSSDWSQSGYYTYHIVQGPGPVA